MALKIEDYALIGDCTTAALVGKDGSIDWLCFPNFDSRACFAALVGLHEHGRWLVSPEEPVTHVERKYLGDTLVLQTEMHCKSGVIRLIDFMPPADNMPDVVRIVEGVSGTVKMQMELTLRFDYGSIVPWVRKTEDGTGIRATAGPDSIVVRAPFPMHGRGLSTVSHFEVKAGDRVPITLTWQRTYDNLSADKPVDADAMLTATQKEWQAWADRCTYHGPYRDKVMRSLLTLRALTFKRSGGIVAAATTSLPEKIGGSRNWDYRYCWLRDATFTLLALGVGGYLDEVKAWRGWLMNSVAGIPQDMQIMYTIEGRRRLDEIELPWLTGYERSRPVRVGNAAYQQRQIDIYGEVIDAMQQAHKLGMERDDNGWRTAQMIINFVKDIWTKPDRGIWEIRGEPQQFVHSKVMAWVAMDRAVKAGEEYGNVDNLGDWKAARDEIHREVCEKGFDQKLNAFTQHYGSAEPDASLLLLPLVGFLPADDPRMVGTVEFVQKTLVRDGFVQRYRNESGVDGLDGQEGSFIICTYWLAQCLVLIGRKDEARKLFERLLTLCNDVGLLAEEYDPVAKRQLGNFPQAFSHVGLVNTARALADDGGTPQRHDDCNSGPFSR